MNDIFDLHVVNDFLDAAMCAELVNDLAHTDAAAATVYGVSSGGSIDETMRKTKRLIPAVKTVDWISSRLLSQRDAVAAHFGLTLTTIEEPQFLRYKVGDFFVAHQDGNTGLILSEREQSRKISVIIFLNQQTESPQVTGYCGGSLVFTEWRPDRKRGRFEMAASAGTLVAFRAETTHEVVPVTNGIRYTIASWFG